MIVRQDRQPIPETFINFTQDKCTRCVEGTSVRIVTSFVARVMSFCLSCSQHSILQ